MEDPIIAALVVSIFFGVTSAALIALCERLAELKRRRFWRRAFNAPQPERTTS